MIMTFGNQGHILNFMNACKHVLNGNQDNVLSLIKCAYNDWKSYRHRESMRARQHTNGTRFIHALGRCSTPYFLESLNDVLYKCHSFYKFFLC